MKEKRTAHIISHTHWDREWYLNSKYTNEWLIEFFERLFDMLEKEKEYVFVLDGQLAMIEDYFEELEKNGLGVLEYKEKITKYVKENRLFIGPYYLQPDWQLLSEESLIRNMLIGNKVADELGGSMKAGWMLDNFGQISQTTQIHKGFNIKGLYVWRGVEMDVDNVQSEFLWESPDGTKLPSIYMLNSYRNVMRLADHKEIMKRRIYDEVDKLKDFATTKHILLMNGYDQEIIPDNVLPYIRNGKMDSEELKIIQSDPINYIDSVLKANSEMITLKGSLYSGRFIAVFPGVMSARMYLKLQNDISQKYLEKYAEPLSSIVWAMGGEYEPNILEQSWKILLKNHPHDSICGVSIDDVHIDMEKRSREVQQLINTQIKHKATEITSLIDTSKSEEEFVNIVFNPSMYNRSEVVSTGDKSRWVADIPAMGYKVIYENEIEKPNDKVKIKDNIIENSKVKVEILENGAFNILHKETGKEYYRLGIFEDRADAGDEYNYSYSDIDKRITSSNSKAEIEYTKKSDEQVVVKIKIVLEIPEKITKDRKRRSEKTIKLPIVNYITINAHSAVVKCRTEIKNTAKDHIIRVLFPTNIKAETSFAGSPFDIVKRPIHIDDYDESDIPENVRKVIIGAREAKPNTIFLQRELVDIHDKEAGLAILSKGLPEYQILKEHNTIAVTLFRSIGWIAKEINSRIGDAGPEIFTPDAQCLRQMVFEYAVYPHKGNTIEGNVVRESDIFNTELLQIKTTSHKGVLDDKMSFFRIEDKTQAIKITGFKRSEDGKAIIIRGYNASDIETESTLHSVLKINKANYVNLLEEEQEEIAVGDDNTIKVLVRAKQIITIRIEVERCKEKLYERYIADIMDYVKREDFDDYESVEYVTEEDIASEQERAEQLKTGLNNPMIRRTALEAQLSVILTQNRYFEHEIRKLGYQLNDARVQRRVHDYIKKYSEID
ncbi:MAG: alpha-mannosidase [Alkaliphilus sp.]